MNEGKGETPHAWIALDAAVCGRKHVRKGMPCQDACRAFTSPRPFAVACDGRGSAPGSHWGAGEAVEAIRTAINIQHLLLETLLDHVDPPENAQCLVELLVDPLYRTACMAQKKCAEQRGGTPSDYDFTLMIFVGGTHRGLTLHVGDGAIVGEVEGQTRVLSAPENGEFANETHFVRYGRTPSMRTGWVNMADLSGVALFSDGTGEGLMESVTGNPSPSFSKIWSGMRDGSFTQSDLWEFLTREDWEPRVQDDRCLALLSRGVLRVTACGKADAATATRPCSDRQEPPRPCDSDKDPVQIELTGPKQRLAGDRFAELVDLIRYLVVLHLAILITLVLIALREGRTGVGVPDSIPPAAPAMRKEE